MSGYIRLGAVISPTGDISYPWWCGSAMTALGFKECQVPTEDEIRAAQRAGVGPAMTPENLAAAIAAGDAAVAVYCRMHTEECAAYRKQAEPTSWLLYGAIAVAAFAGLSLIGGRR